MSPLRARTLLVTAGVVVLLVSAWLTTGAATQPRAAYLLVAYGDSFTRAADPLVGDQPDESWATGTANGLGSILQRLQSDQPSAKAFNAAMSGARADDLVRQVGTSPRGADLVVVWIGINDACQNVDLPGFEQALGRGLDALAAAHPDATVVVYAVPNLGRLGAVHAHDPGARLVRSVWPYCAQYLLPGPTAATRFVREATLDQLNDVLRAQAHAHGFAYSSSTHELAFAPSDLSSLDYFHPTPAGQAKIAEWAWQAIAPPPAAPRAFLVLA